ncbi:MAG: DUF4153 domain-containing protein [Litoreibacter sp.]
MPTRTREIIILTMFGALAGLAFYSLFEWMNIARGFSTVTLGITVFAVCFFGGALKMTGPIPLKDTLLPVAGFSVVVSGLILWASLRFPDAQAFLDTGHPFAVVAVIFLIGIPFLVAAIQPDASPANYVDLFDISWGAITRLLVSAAFTGMFWLLLLLSNQLLSLVGISVIEIMIEADAVPAVLTGAVFGMAIAVAYELSEMFSPQLILRLLRLLMPMITTVVAIFVAALPFRGISNLFGELSAGAVMMGMGLIATSLVSASIDRTSAQGVQRKWMKGFVQLLAYLIPILGGLSIAAVWLRIDDYGWTPDRLVAITVAFIVLAYGIVYTFAVLRRGNWDDRLRQGNIALALGVVSITALWLTPVLNPQAISTKSQIARLDSGESLDKLPLYEMAHDWGHAGTSEFSKLKARFEASDDAEALEIIAAAQSATYRYQFSRRKRDQEREQQIARLDDVIIVHPNRDILPSELFIGAPSSYQPIIHNCLGNDQNCVLISVPKIEEQAAHFILFTNLDNERSTMWSFTRKSAEETFNRSRQIKLDPATKQDLRNGVYTIGRPRWSSVQLEGVNIHRGPLLDAE